MPGRTRPKCVDKELRNVGLGEPGRIVFNNLHHLGWLALNRNHPRPCESGPAVLARTYERIAVSRHLLLTESAYDGGWQHPFNEHVLLKNHPLAAFGSKALKSAACIFRPVGPCERSDDRFHVNDTLHPVAIPLTVKGRHFVQEDSPDEIGQAVADFVRRIRSQ